MFLDLYGSEKPTKMSKLGLQKLIDFMACQIS